MYDAFVTFHAHQHPDRPAVVTPGGSMSFGELETRVSQFARALADLRLRPDGLVAVQCADPLVHWLLLLALARLGVPSSCAADTAASLLITDQPDPGRRQASVHVSSAWIAAARAGSGDRYPAATPPRDGIGRVLLSSGTTGTPKRVGLTWAMIHSAIRGGCVLYGTGRAGPWLIADTGVDTTFGFTASLAGWAYGQPLLFRNGLSLVAALARWEPAVLALVPIQVQHAVASLPPRFKPVPALRLFVPGGVLNPALAREARLRLTPDIRSVYGASECGVAAMGDVATVDEHPGAVGYAVPGSTIEVLAADGSQAAPGEPGEVRVRTDRLADGYLDPDTRGPSPIRDGWFYPGDLGRLREDGLLILDGRIDDVMNIGGLKVKASTIDDALAGCPGLVESFAFAAPTEAGADECCIAVVTTDGFDRDAVVSRLRATEAPPRSVRLFTVDRLPRTPTGKVERAALVAMAAANR